MIRPLDWHRLVHQFNYHWLIGSAFSSLFLLFLFITTVLFGTPFYLPLFDSLFSIYRVWFTSLLYGPGFFFFFTYYHCLAHFFFFFKKNRLTSLIYHYFLAHLFIYHSFAHLLIYYYYTVWFTSLFSIIWLTLSFTTVWIIPLLTCHFICFCLAQSFIYWTTFSFMII